MSSSVWKTERIGRPAPLFDIGKEAEQGHRLAFLAWAGTIPLMSAASGALEGVVVLDFSQILAGPFCSMMLADLGARVIKIERPGRGDDTRSWGPPWAGDVSAYFLAVNRGKQSVTIDLKKPEGIDLALSLAKRSDVMLQNFRPGVMQRLGLDHAAVDKLNPRIIYCSISSFGSDGPYAQRIGYDALIQAMGGLMSITGDRSGSPTKVGVAIVDILSGLYALSGILSALHARERTGRGQHVDIALLDSLVGSLANQAQSYLVTQVAPGRLGNAHPSIVPYQTFAAADGSFMLAVGNDDQFQRLCTSIGTAELAADARFASNSQRVANRDELVSTLNEHFRVGTVASWLERFEAASIPAGPLNDLAAVFADPQVQHRGMVAELSDRLGQVQRFAGNPIKLSQTPTVPQGFPPELGCDTDDVLRELLGLEDDQLLSLRRNGVTATVASQEKDPQ